MSQIKLLILRILFFISAAVVLGFIFYHSTRIGDSSAFFSQNATSRLNQILMFFHIDRIIPEAMVRKMAHFGEYCLLAVFITAFLLTFIKLKLFWKLCIPFVIGIGTASLDELIQHYTPGRSGQITDVLLDSSGVILGILTTLCIFFFIQKVFIKSHHEKL